MKKRGDMTWRDAKEGDALKGWGLEDVGMPDMMTIGVLTWRGLTPLVDMKESLWPCAGKT